MLTITIELSEEEAKATVRALDDVSSILDGNILNTSSPAYKAQREKLIVDKNLVDHTKSKIDKALCVPRRS